MLPPQGSVGGLPPASLVAHLDHIRQQDMVVRARIPCPGSGVPGMRANEPTGLGRGGASTPTATDIPGHIVEVVEGGVSLGVDDQMHVLGSADHP
jgi:hypothetical protein